MEDKILNTYLEYLGNLKKDENYKPTVDENTAIYSIAKDTQYADLNKKLNKAKDVSEKMKIVSDYKIEQELKKSKDEKDIISKIYGINVEDIDSMKLDSGIEIFSFYDSKLGRKRVIENLGKQTLVERLKEIQNDKNEFQTGDYKKNSENMLKNEALNNNNRQELKMVEIDEYINHPESYGVINEDTSRIINKINSEKEKLGIKYINVENKIILTKDNKIIEISKTKEGDFVLNEPIKRKQKVNSIDNSEKVMNNENIKKTTSINEDIKIEKNEFEDKSEFISAKEIDDDIKANNLSIDKSTEEIISNIKMYYEDPIKMENIEDENERAFYDRMVNEIYAVKKAEYEKKKTQKKIYTNPELNNKGFANLIFISILLLFLAFILFLGL